MTVSTTPRTTAHPDAATADAAAGDAAAPVASSRADGAESEAPGHDLADLTIVVIGAGNMGGPVVQAFLASGADASTVLISNSTPDSSARAAQELGATAAQDRASALGEADVVVLGVKPYQIVQLTSEIAELIREDAIVISLAAGITLQAIEDVLPTGHPVVRAMPNTPISVGEGAVGLMRGSAVTDSQHALVRALFGQAGVVEDITEEQVHAFIGAAGSLSAFTFSLIEAMTDEAVRLGLKRDLADRLVQQTVRGAATMLMRTGQHPAVAKNGVSSPGGTTAEGLAVMERQGVRPGIAAAMQAAAERSRELTGE